MTFGACDHGAIHDTDALRRLFDRGGADVAVWAVRGHAEAARRPEAFGWIDARDGRIAAMSVKRPLASPAADPIATGTFTFRSGTDFRRCFARLAARGGRVNGEFYIDSCIEDALALGLDCRAFEVDRYKRRSGLLRPARAPYGGVVTNGRELTIGGFLAIAALNVGLFGWLRSDIADARAG